MNEAGRITALIRACQSDRVTDGERVTYGWFYAKHFPSAAEAIRALAEKLPDQERQVLATAAANVLAAMQNDELGLGIGRNVSLESWPPDHVPREFITSLSGISRGQNDSGRSS